MHFVWKLRRIKVRSPDGAVVCFLSAVAIVRPVGPPPFNDEGVQPPKEPYELIDGGVVANDPAFQVSILFKLVCAAIPDALSTFE